MVKKKPMKDLVISIGFCIHKTKLCPKLHISICTHKCSILQQYSCSMVQEVTTVFNRHFFFFYYYFFNSILQETVTHLMKMCHRG